MIPIPPPLDGVSTGVLGYFNRTETIAGPRPIKGHDEGIQEIAIQGVMVPSEPKDDPGFNEGACFGDGIMIRNQRSLRKVEIFEIWDVGWFAADICVSSCHVLHKS